MLLLLPLGAFGQLARTAQEIWPAVDIYYRINPKWRVYTTFSATKGGESSYTDGAVGVFGDYFAFSTLLSQKFWPDRRDSLPGKFVWFRFGYQYSAAAPSSEDPFKENMIVTEANPRFYLPWKILLTAKNRFDWRVNNDQFKIRYRPRLTFEKDLRTEYLFFTATAFTEYFVNFGSSSVNRLRTQLGLEIRVSKHINYEVFWNHQFANEPEIQSVDAFGMSLKVYLDHKEMKHAFHSKKSKKAAQQKTIPQG